MPQKYYFLNKKFSFEKVCSDCVSHFGDHEKGKHEVLTGSSSIVDEINITQAKITNSIMEFQMTQVTKLATSCVCLSSLIVFSILWMIFCFFAPQWAEMFMQMIVEVPILLQKIVLLVMRGEFQYFKF